MAHNKTPPVEIFFDRDLTEEDIAFLRSPECGYSSDDIRLILGNHIVRYEKALSSHCKLMVIVMTCAIVFALSLVMYEHIPFWNNMLSSINQQIKLILEQAPYSVIIMSYIVIIVGSYWLWSYLIEVGDRPHKTAYDCHFLSNLINKKTSAEQPTISP